MKTSKHNIMRNLILILCFIPLISFSQKTDIFIKLTDSKGQQIKGEVMLKGYERCISAMTLSPAGKNDTQFTFTIPISGTSADLKRVSANGEVLSGHVTVLSPVQSLGVPFMAYTMKMENIVIVSSNEVVNEGNVMNTTITLRATRVGWTYYKAGTQTISGKFGWDSDTKSEWTNF
jgi:type VI protein secretion system component Hcp